MQSGEALGLIETRGFVAAIAAADQAVKTAFVELAFSECIGGGLVVIMFRGEVAAVKAAVDAGAVAAKRVGELISVHVIPRPYSETNNILESPDWQLQMQKSSPRRRSSRSKSSPLAKSPSSRQKKGS